MKHHKLRTLISLGAISTFVIHLFNRYTSMQSGVKEVLPLYNYQYFSFKSGRIFYTKKGNGSPLLLIHELLPGGSGYEWNRIEDELSKEHTLYVVDLPGCGRSSKKGYQYTNSLFTQMITSFVKDVVREKCDVITSGNASSIILMAAFYQKNLFNKIIMVNPVSLSSISKPFDTTGKIYKTIIDMPIFGTLIYYMHVSKESVSSLIINQYYYNPFHADRDIMDAYYEASHIGGYHCKDLYASLASHYYNADLTKALNRLSVPVLIINGGSEKNQKRNVSGYLHCQPSLQCKTMYHCKHIPHVEKPSEFITIVKSFL